MCRRDDVTLQSVSGRESRSEEAEDTSTASRTVALEVPCSSEISLAYPGGLTLLTACESPLTPVNTSGRISLGQNLHVVFVNSSLPLRTETQVHHC
jgi:hypothetical protein